MPRILFEYLLPLALPTALYAIWLLWQRRQAAGAGIRVPAWAEGPWFWLVLAGIGLAIGAFVATALFEGYKPGDTYIPAQLKGGQIQPGQFKDE